MNMDYFEDEFGISLYELVVGSASRPKPPKVPSVLIPIDVAAPNLEIPAKLQLHSGQYFCIEGSAHASRGPEGVRPLTAPSILLRDRLVETVSSYFVSYSGVFAGYLLQKGLLQGRRRSAPIHHIVQAVRQAAGDDNVFLSFMDLIQEIHHLSAVEFVQSMGFGVTIPHQFFSILMDNKTELRPEDRILTWAMYIPMP